MGLLDNVLGSSFDDPRTAATLQLAQGLLSSPRVMQGLAGGLSGYQQAMAQAKQAKALEEYRAMQMQQMRSQMEAQQRQQAQAATDAGLTRQAFTAVKPIEANAASGIMGPRPEALAPVGKLPSFDPAAFIASGGSRDLAFEIQKAMAPKTRKVKDYKEIRNADGSVTIAGFDEEGNVIDTKAQPFKAAEVRDFGGFVGGVDPITGKVQRLGDKTQSPDSKASNSLGWANYALSKDRLNLDRQNGGEGKAPQGYRWKSDGTLEPIKGGPADRQATASEGERKSATLLARLEGSMGQLSDVVSKNPGAAKPGFWSSAAGSTPVIGEAFKNIVSSSDRQRVEAAQLDMLDAALTLGTGAAYTREQLEGYRRSYFPQIGDSDATVKDKQQRLATVIQAARISAGRAAQSADKAAGVSAAPAQSPVLRWNEQTMSFDYAPDR